MSEPDPTPLYPAPLARLIAASIDEIEARLSSAMPGAAARLLGWMGGLSGGAPCDYFLHPSAFPTLLFPFWVDRALCGDVDPALQADLCRSSICGYYFIRLIDDVMDQAEGADATLLPAAAFFHAEFHAAYAARFPPGHPFWEAFYRDWYGAGDAAIVDAGLTDVDEERFLSIAARKVGAGRIPMAAVAHLRTGAGLPARWAALFSKMAQFHQFHNDFLDWQRDAERGRATAFLTLARTRAREGESLAAWMIREGVLLGTERLLREIDALHAAAREVPCPELLAYLAARRGRLRARAGELRAGAAALSAILSVGGGPSRLAPGRSGR